MEALSVSIIVQGCTRKLPEFRRLVDHFGVSASVVTFYGDDMPELTRMEFT